MKRFLSSGAKEHESTLRRVRVSRTREKVGARAQIDG